MRSLLLGKHVRLGFLTLCCAGLLAPRALAQQGEEITVSITSSMVIDAAGNAHVQGTMSFNPPRGYDRVKRVYPNLYVLFRDVGPERSSAEINRNTMKITSDDGQRSITFNCDVYGAAVSRQNHWQVQLAPNEQVSMQDPTKISTVIQPSGQSSLKWLMINTYSLPSRAQGVQIDKESHLLTYTLPTPRPPTPPSPAQVDVTVRNKQRLMSAVYKVYGDPEARGGAYWVAKTIFKNTGKSPISDLKISYRLGDYTELSVPDPYTQVPPGGVVVDAYYPVIRARVTELKTRTPVQLYVRYEYRDASGRIASSEMTKRMEMLGVNQFEFSNLNDDDRTDSWFDYFNNAPLLSAFVTRLDDPVKQFAGFVSQAAGGAAAASDKASALRWLEGAYEMELLNDIVYSTPSGFLTNEHSSGQDIKYPRDVFRDKTGTCVDLAITYAALAETVGLKAALMVVPGHTFPVVQLPDGQWLPVESTGLGGGNQRMSFQQAVDTGMKELPKYVQDGLFYFVNVENEWNNDRVPNPELVAVGSDFLRTNGIRPLSELSGVRNASLGGGGVGGGGGTPGAGPGLAGNRLGTSQGKAFRVVHDHGMGKLTAYCVGILSISGDTITFQAQTASDGRLDRFEIKKSDIREARKNRLPMGQAGRYFQGFHIRLANGVNYNFAAVNEQGMSLSPDEILMAITQ